MARRKRKTATPPTSEELEGRAQRKVEERLSNWATPPQQRNPDEDRPNAAVPGPTKRSNGHDCPGKQLYRVAGNHIVHGVQKGGTVHLCPHTGATRALVQGGHLVPSKSATARAVTASSSVSDDTKGEPDHG